MWAFLRNVEAVHEFVILLQNRFLPIPYLTDDERLAAVPVTGLPNFFRVSQSRAMFESQWPSSWDYLLVASSGPASPAPTHWLHMVNLPQTCLPCTYSLAPLDVSLPSSHGVSISMYALTVKVVARYGYMDIVDHGPEFVQSVVTHITAQVQH